MQGSRAKNEESRQYHPHPRYGILHFDYHCRDVYKRQEYTESIFISAKQRGNTEELQKMLINAAHLPTVTQNDIIGTNVRHYEALSKACLLYTSTDTYLVPENVGMPFNSPYNDYMYVIDEYNNLGWFA